MKHSIYIIFSMCVIFTSCKKFDEYNINSNAPETVNPQFLLSNVLAEASDNQAYWGWHAGNFLAQHASNLEFLPVDRYDLGNNEGLWSETYRLMNDLETISKYSSEGNDAYTAVANILKAHQASLLTDLWNYVPYFDALKGRTDNNFTPVFDSQESIYLADEGILDLLRKSVEALENTSQSIEGDLMYQGNLENWIRFANSLRVRYLVRISSPHDSTEELQEIVDSGMLFTSNFDHAVVPYLNSAPNQWIIFNEREGRYVDVRMSTTSQEILENLDDPRISVLYKPTVNSIDTDPLFSGIPNGLSRENQLAFDLGDVSLMGSFLRDVPDGVTASFMTYAELQFCLAEASFNGLISGSAEQYYNQGIQASFDFYDLELPSDYFSSSDVMLDGTDDLKRIMTQKWIANFMNGYESWFDIRRTGFPELPIPPDNINGDVYPVRYLYPTSEQAVNGTNYANASAAIGGDTNNSKGWWEQ